MDSTQQQTVIQTNLWIQPNSKQSFKLTCGFNPTANTKQTPNTLSKRRLNYPIDQKVLECVNADKSRCLTVRSRRHRKDFTCPNVLINGMDAGHISETRAVTQCDDYTPISALSQEIWI